MKQSDDVSTIDLFGPRKAVRGRPKGDTPALSASDRQALRRARLREIGLVPVTLVLPVVLIDQLERFIQFKGITKSDVVEKALKSHFRKR